MEIIKFNDGYIQQVVSLWNECIDDGFIYKPLTIDTFKEKFIKNPDFDYNGTFIVVSNGNVIGFANGIYRKTYLPGETFESVPGYITMVIVKRIYRNKGIGRALLDNVEKYLIDVRKKKIHIDFFNPINLEWYIPGTDGHDHPNTPGVDTMGPGYSFFKKAGYTERTKEISMYLDLKYFSLSDIVKDKYMKFKEKGITIEYYDAKKHHGLREFFDNLKNEYWRKEIIENLSSQNPYPVIVASHNGSVIGFTGPIEVQDSGRGKFTGIGVDPSYQGEGIGNVLFFKLCESFKNEGAKFMSLFTGINNNARKMYERAGFTIVREWALFEKE